MILLATAFTVTYSLRLLFMLIKSPQVLNRVIGGIEDLNTIGSMRVLFFFAVVRGSIMG